MNKVIMKKIYIKNKKKKIRFSQQFYTHITETQTYTNTHRQHKRISHEIFEVFYIRVLIICYINYTLII